MRPGEILAIRLRNIHEMSIEIDQLVYRGDLDNAKGRKGKQTRRTVVLSLAQIVFLVYSAVGENAPADAKGQLYLRRLDQTATKAITGTEGGISPFLSPDDRWVGFWAAGKLMKVPVDGGVPVLLCDAATPFGASWGPDGRIAFVPGEGVGLSVVPSDGGKAEVLTTLDRTKNEYSHRLPRYFPDGGSLLVTTFREPWDLAPQVAVVQLSPLRWHYLLEDADRPYPASVYGINRVRL